MKKYVITYDLRAPGRDYGKLFEAIQSYPNWCHLVESVWIVWSDRTADEICNHLLKYVDRNDQLWVGGWTGEAAWYGLDTQRSNWLSAA